MKPLLIQPFKVLSLILLEIGMCETMSCGCRITQHLKLKECEGFGIQFSSSPKFLISSYIKPQLSQPTTNTIGKLLAKTSSFAFSSSSSSIATSFPFISCLQSKFPREVPILEDSSFRFLFLLFFCQFSGIFLML